MDKTIDQIANLVATQLNAAKAEIAKGKQEIQKYVAGLEPSLRQVGQKAAQNIQGKFDELEQSVDNKQDDLIDSLALKYNDNVKALDVRIDEMKAENRGLVEKAKEAIVDTIKTINELKNMLMGVLQRAAGAIGKIIQDPIGFLGHLIAGLKQGFLNFKDNISQHLKKGFMGFLTGAMASAGIQMPKSFDMKGIFTLVTQVLGMTYEGIRPKAVKRMGEKNVNALESNFEMFVILKNEGTGGLWKFIQGQIGDLKSMVIDTLQSFIIEKVIISGITWILSLLNPASAFVRACKAIIDIIMFFIERASQIAELINAVIEAVTAIAGGAIGGAAKAIENALSKSLPVVISFMASLLGIGGISDKVQEVIKRVSQPIEKAINWVIEQAVKFAKKIGGKLGFGKGKKGNKDNKEKSEKEHQALAKQAVSELEKTDGNAKDYKTLRAEKQEQARQIEQSYTAKLEKGIKLTVHFENAVKDEKDGKFNFQVVIAPNTTVVPGSIAFILNQHQSNYVALVGTRYMLKPEYQNKTFTRDRCYGKSYRKNVYDWKNKQLSTPHPPHGSGLRHPTNMNEYLYNGSYYTNSGNTSIASLDHKPMVVQHWNSIGRDTYQTERKDFFNDLNHITIVPLSLNSSDGASSGENYNYEVGEDFRGPGE
jgi:hypothetical protein